MGKELPNEESELIEEDVEEEEETTEVSDDETPEESAREALKELESQSEDDTGDLDEEEDESSAESLKGTEGQAKKEVKAKVKKKGKVDTGPVRAHANMNAEERNLFNGLPDNFKPAVNRLFKNQQSHFTKNTQEQARVTGEARHIVEAVRPYYASQPDFAKNGITESQIVSALVGSHQKITNPKTARQELSTIANSVGLQVKFVDEDGDELPETSNGANLQGHPEIQTLLNDNKQLKSRLDRHEATVAGKPITDDLVSVRDEKDASGKHVYPELQHKSMWEYARPRVFEKRGNDPDLSFGNAMREVIAEYRKKIGYSLSTTEARPPVKNKAVKAATTARGRIASKSSVSLTDQEQEVGEFETPQQSAEIAFENLKRGIN